MNKIQTLVIFIFLVSCSSTNIKPIINAHAHNDYEHENPLFDALDNLFISVEVDVHFIDGELFVSHNTPKSTDSLETLETLYLEPLLNRINQNQGHVYTGYNGFFYLMIDIKTESATSYEKLKDVLRQYESIISLVKNGNEEKNKPVKVVVTGFDGRPFNQILTDEPKYVTIDGRPNELGRGISAAIMPYISDNYNKYFSFTGKGEVSKKDSVTITNLVNATHKEGKKLRFWASPDNEAVWNFLLSYNVDLINTDKLEEFNKFWSERK